MQLIWSSDNCFESYTPATHRRFVIQNSHQASDLPWLAACLYIGPSRVPLWIHREMVTSTPALAHTDNFSVVCGAVQVRSRRCTSEKSYFISRSCSFRREGTPGLEKVPRSPLKPLKSLDRASGTLGQKKTTGHYDLKKMLLYSETCHLTRKSLKYQDS